MSTVSPVLVTNPSYFKLCPAASWFGSLIAAVLEISFTFRNEKFFVESLNPDGPLLNKHFQVDFTDQFDRMLPGSGSF